MFPKTNSFKGGLNYPLCAKQGLKDRQTSPAGMSSGQGRDGPDDHPHGSDLCLYAKRIFACIANRWGTNTEPWDVPMEMG